MARLTATEAARSFSDVLNRAATGEEIEITRSGSTVAVIGPPKARVMSADRYRELMNSAPPIDDDFATDLRDVRADARPVDSSWPS